MLTDEEIISISEPILDIPLYEEDVCKFARAVIAHISTPPAGMVLVPEEPEEWRIKAGLKVNLANADERAIVINIWQTMIAAKEPK